MAKIKRNGQKLDVVSKSRPEWKWLVFPEQKESYRENGYLVVEKVFSSKECDELQRILEKHADKNFSALMNPDRTIPQIRKLMGDPRILDILEQLQDVKPGDLDGLMTQMLFKKGGTPYATQAWNAHQDNAYPQALHGAYITINIFFEDADRENGCLVVYPGSHKEKLLPFTPRVSFREKVGTNPGNSVILPAKYKGKETDVVVYKGGAVVLHGDVVHGSHPNLSKTRSRPLLQVIYITKGVDFISGKIAKRERIQLR